MTAVQTIFFDLDGTLIDHFRAIHRCYNYILREFSLPERDYADLKKRIGPPLPVTVAELVGRPDPDLVERFCRRFRAHMQETFLDGLEELPGASWILDQLHRSGRHLAIFSNKQIRTVEAICGHLGFDKFLAGIVATEERVDCPRKPEAAFSRHALAQLKTTAELATLVGDSAVDHRAALAGNFAKTYTVATGTHDRDELVAQGIPPDSIFANLFALGTAVFHLKR
ncbi:MAG: HAD family hydrolase [Puniceicoccales bacterium]|jgi:phosphoglycolate phosphatase|nr:HAD family hydrolase [Puniceicoccales bacterium]